MNPSGHPRILIAEPERYASVAAEAVVSAILAAVRSGKRASVALAGGQTPKPIYEAIASKSFRARVPWLAVRWFFGDERAVPADDAQSNYRMVKEALFDTADLPATTLHRMEADSPDRDAASKRYEALMPDPLDLVLLGMGEDGHCASLFPGSSALLETKRRVLPVTGSKAPRERMTVTRTVIERARETIVFATGEAKASMVARALAEDGSEREIPARLARRGLWILDPAASAALPASSKTTERRT